MMSGGRYLVLSVVLAAVVFVGACAPDEAPPEAEPYAVGFLARSIDLEPYVQGFPYNGFSADFEAGTLRYFHRTSEGNHLMVQPLNVGPGSGLIDPVAGRQVHDIDWSTRSFWGTDYDAAQGQSHPVG